jgi:hypothetical protein
MFSSEPATRGILITDTTTFQDYQGQILVALRTDDSSVAEKMTRSYTKALQNNCWFYDRHEKLLVLT